MGSCSPHVILPGKMIQEPRLTETVFISFDGAELPLKTWLPPIRPKAVFIALHGYNDYSNFIRDAAPYFNDRGVALYAYDQRGFGGAPHRGKWPGYEALCRDLRTIIALVLKRHPDVPLYLLGDSMGGAVIMVAERQEDPLPVDGMVLVAPAVWSRGTMPFYQRWLLGLTVRIMPWLQVTGKQLDITPSDNQEMLRVLGRDPLVIKESRIDALYGLTNLMDAAYHAAPRFNTKALFLYGAKDEIIPPQPMADVFRQRMKAQRANQQRFLLYSNGYHMLLRDLQAEIVLQDILFWLDSSFAPFPSVEKEVGREITKEEVIKAFLLSGS